MQRMRWYVVDFGVFDGVENMAIDMSMMDIARTENVAVLRFYAWKVPTLSLGKFQNLKDVDVKNVKRMGFDLVRRPSGGRAVLHYDELTYAVAFPESAVPSSVLRTYLEVSKALVVGLKKLGIEATLEREKPTESYTQFAACFATTALYEVKVEEKKLIGSAQVRKNSAVLQHGSVPMRSHIKEYVKCFLLSKENAEKLEFLLKGKTTCLDEHANATVDELRQALLEGFEETFDFVRAPFKKNIDFIEHVKDVKIC